MSLMSWFRVRSIRSMPLFPIVALALAPAGCSGGKSEPPPIDLILWNGRVTTLDPALPQSQAIAIRGDLIAAVGSNSEILELAAPTTRRINLEGQTVIPGLVDAHAHVLGLGNRLAELDLRGLTSPQAVADKVTTKAASTEAGAWISGGGWDQNLWPCEEFPHHKILSAAAPDHPVLLSRVDGHAAWANERALQVAGITRETQDPPGGTIVRDAAGEPTGVFIDNAIDMVGKFRPRATHQEIKASLQRALRRCAEVGLTGIHDAGVDEDVVAAYRELADDGELPLRVYLMWDGRSGEALEPLVAQAPIINYRNRLTLRAVKLMIDGAMGSRGAAFMEDYSDDPGNRGLLVTPAAEIERLSILAMQNGYQVCTHAIGDRGVRLTLDAYEKALATVGDADHRPRIEHLQCTTRDDVLRLKRMNGIASMQPSHATSDMPWAEERVGPERGKGLYAWRWVLDAGIPLAAGSDFPVEHERPVDGLMAAVTRQDSQGQPDGGWHPDQRMTFDEALRAYTTGAAYAAFEEAHKGRITPGFWADLTVLSESPAQLRPTSIRNLAIGYTIVGGQVIFESP